MSDSISASLGPAKGPQDVGYACDNALVPDLEEARAFVEAIQVDQLQLTFIKEDPAKPGARGRPTSKLWARTLAVPTGWPQAAELVERGNRQGWNVYWTLNEVRSAFNTKANKPAIHRARFLWCDLDPRPGKVLAEERALLQRLLTTLLPKGLPPPTHIIDSGNGFWGLWRLGRPIDLPTTPPGKHSTKEWRAAVAHIEGHCRGINEAFRQLGYRVADDCQNLDRICRLPGTVNWPGQKKAGRQPALARWLREGM